MSIINNKTAKANIDLKIKKIQQGLFNICIIWGPTRSGKSTIARQMAYYMSKELNRPFSVKNNIWFEVEELEKACNDPRREGECFILDEASFDLMSSDVGNKFQRALMKFYNTAAKYHQTHFILMPNLQQLKKDFLLDYHAYGFQTSIRFNKKKKEYEKGRGTAFNRIDMARQYDLWKHQQYEKAINYRGNGYMFTFTAEEPYLTEEQFTIYEAKKDAAIKSSIKTKEKKEKDSKFSALFDENDINE